MEKRAAAGQSVALTEGDFGLPRPPGVIREFWVRHPWWTDSLVSGLYAVPTFLLTLAMAVTPRLNPDPGWLITLGLVSVVVASAALLFRRYHPWSVLAVTLVTTLAAFPLHGNADAFAVPLALYALAVYGSVRAVWVGLAGSIVIGTAGAYLSFDLHRDETLAAFAYPPSVVSTQFAVLMLLATLIGINIGNRKRYLAALIDRAAQLGKERDQQAQLASAVERARIAREMHDIVSHSLSVMVTLADGSAATAGHAPDRAAVEMRQVAETGRHALTDMRRMLGVLNGGVADLSAVSGSELAPQPGTADLAPLIGTFRAAGLPVRFDETGAPPTDSGEQLAVYRIIQESLTNALRYAGQATVVAVEIRYDETETRVTVVDDGRASVRRNRSDPGHGLVGMRERVAQYGGTMECGPRPEGGWRVNATLVREREVAR